MVLAYGVLSTGGTATSLAREYSSSLRKLNAVRSLPSLSMMVSSACIHSLSCTGSRSGGSTAQWPDTVRSDRSVIRSPVKRAPAQQADEAGARLFGEVAHATPFAEAQGCVSGARNRWFWHKMPR